MTKKKIIDALTDSRGNITAVKIEGNRTFTPLETAIRMTLAGKLDLVVVTSEVAKQHLRTKPDRTTENNLDEMGSRHYSVTEV